jgi:hypothetical protein
MIIEASKLPNVILVFLNNKLFYVNKQHSHIHEYKRLFVDDLLAIFTNRTILLPFNVADDPKVLVPDDRNFKNLNQLGNDKFYSFKRNVCMKKRFEKLTQFHSYFSYANITLTPLLPVFSVSRTKCHSDILMPAHYHTRPGLVDRVVWKDKTELFTWHGTTMPNTELNSIKQVFGLNDKILKMPR